MMSYRMSGFAEIEGWLQALPEKVGESALRSAANAGATVIKDEVVLRAPQSSGRLKRAVYQKHIDERSGETNQTYFVGVRQGTKTAAGKKDLANDAFYWRFVEYGTSKPAWEARSRSRIASTASRLREKVAEAIEEMIR
jgi:HK97 gp10 family phage protein